MYPRSRIAVPAPVACSERRHGRASTADEGAQAGTLLVEALHDRAHGRQERIPAALVDLINEERHEHILTIEDPIEYLHPSKRCLVNQRSVHRHTESFARALRAALREDPDVIVVGELRDLETISLALSAAETGHLVMATLHTNNAIRTLNRIIGAFPADQQGQVRMMISESLRVVISQRLIPRADGQGRVAAIENLVVNRAVGNLIRENKTFQIHSILQTGSSQGMILLDHSIKALLDAGTISREEALRNCEDAKILGG